MFEVALKKPDDESSIDESSISIKAVQPHKKSSCRVNHSVFLISVIRRSVFRPVQVQRLTP